MAKNSEYSMNQYGPIRTPCLRISMPMCTMFRDTLMAAAAQA